MSKQKQSQQATPTAAAALQRQTDPIQTPEAEQESAPAALRQPAAGPLASLPPRPPSAAQAAVEVPGRP